MIASSCRVVMCCMRLGDCMLARYDNIDLQYFLTKKHPFFSREAIELLNKLANINGISALCQVRQALQKIIHKHCLTLPKIRLWTRLKGWKSRGWRRWETGAHSWTNNHSSSWLYLSREFTSALETIDQALSHASGCVRLKMARGDCLAHLGR